MKSPIYKEKRMKELNTQLYIMYITEGKGEMGNIVSLINCHAL